MNIYICMYVCVYVCMHVCMHACMHACMNACMYVMCILYHDVCHASAFKVSGINSYAHMLI